METHCGFMGQHVALPFRDFFFFFFIDVKRKLQERISRNRENILK